MSLILSGTDGLSDVDGSAATPAIRGTDANTGIFFGADIIGFSEGGAEVARFNADAQFVAAAGTASLPVITTTGDVNTGVFFPAADTIAFTTGGTEDMRIDSAGNVGIGTSSPGAKLDVRGSSSFLINATNPTAWVSVDSALTTGSIYNQWNTASNVGISGTYTNHPYTFVTNNTERMRIDSSGNVGIGQTSQVWDEKLGVRLATSGSGTVGLGVYSASTTYASSMIRVQAETGGSGWKMYEGRANGGSQLFWVDGSGGAYFAGNVGIGTSSPSTRLHTYTASGENKLIVEAGAASQSATLSLQTNNTTPGACNIYMGKTGASTNGQVGYDPNNNFLYLYTNNTERMRIDSSGNLLFNSGYGSVATAYGCRAWVNFNGTGVVAIRASGNVTSITDNGTGDYTVNFTNAMPDVNYSIVGSSGSGNTYGSYAFNNPGAGSRFAVGSCRINSFITQSAGLADVDTVCVSVFR